MNAVLCDHCGSKIVEPYGFVLERLHDTALPWSAIRGPWHFCRIEHLTEWLAGDPLTEKG